mgnify:CR=1 FL=1
MKLKRLFTAALSAALALSLCAMPAMAVDGTGTAVKTSTGTIDTTQEGSITIYKRALDSGEAEGTAGDGETMENPQGTALKDTGFTLYRVMNTEQLLAYYNDNTTDDQVDVKKYFTDYDTDKTAAGLKTGYAAYGVQKLTGADGKVSFTGLPVGMYLVIETKTPQAVTKPVKPFLVSIPMTRIGDETTGTGNQNQKEWLYDVTVYPKNSIAKGTVTLVKQGKQGDATTKLEGVKFTLNKKNDADERYTAVKTDVATDNKGEISLENLTKGRYYLQETGYTDGNDKGYILNTTGKFYFDIDESGKAVKVVDPTITDKVDDESFAIDSTNAILTVTNYKPDIEKTVTKRDGSTAHEADYGVDDAVPYTLTIKVPENITSLKTFTVTDTTLKAQLVQNKDSVVISGKKKDGGDATLTAGMYTVEVAEDNDNSVMTVAFTPSDLADVAGGEITIAYTATVQATAAVAGDGNVNTAKIVYSRKTNLTTETGTDQPYEITDKGVVYTFGLNIHKTAKGGDKDGQGLKDVTFDLYKKVESYEIGTDGKVATKIRGIDYNDSNLCADAKKLGLTTVENEKWIKVETLTTGENGYVTAAGLPSGTYKLVETKTVEGYNLLSKPVDAKLNLTYTATWTTTKTYDDNGNQIKAETNTTTYTRDSATVANPNDEKVEIVNRAGFTLPVTGGFGTLLFSGIGLLLVLVGVSVLFSLKKKTNRA